MNTRVQTIKTGQVNGPGLFSCPASQSWRSTSSEIPGLAGALAFDPQQKSLRFSLGPSNLGAQASYVVFQIYGGAPVNALIPQAVYYNGFDRGENFSGRIIEGRRQIEKSSHPDRDRYNLALNVLTDLWLVDFEKSGQKITDPPREGVYLRDAHEDLYLVEEAQK